MMELQHWKNAISHLEPDEKSNPLFEMESAGPPYQDIAARLQGALMAITKAAQDLESLLESPQAMILHPPQRYSPLTINLDPSDS